MLKNCSFTRQNTCYGGSKRVLLQTSYADNQKPIVIEKVLEQKHKNPDLLSYFARKPAQSPSAKHMLKKRDLKALSK